LPGKTKIQNLYLAIREDENILRLQVSMNDFAVVRRGKTARDLNGDVNRFTDG
jgi:hypothetical protein